MTMRDCAWLWMLDAGSGHAELRMKLLFTQHFVLLQNADDFCHFSFTFSLFSGQIQNSVRIKASFF